MKPHIRLRAVIALAIVAPLGLALAHQFSQGNGPAIDQMIPHPLSMASFGKVLSGEFNGDAVLDAVVMNGTTPEMVVWPESHANATAVIDDENDPDEVNDFAVISGLYTGRDAILTVSDEGLKMYDWVGLPTGWNVFDAPEGWSTGDWLDARLVRTGEFNGSAGVDIAGVSADGKRVMFLMNDNSTGTPSFTAGTSLNTSYNITIYDTVVLNWSNDGTMAGKDEIACFNSWGWWVWNMAGASQRSGAWSQSTIRGAKISVPSSTDRLAMVVASGGNDWVSVYGPLSELLGPTNLGAVGVVSVASGDEGGVSFTGGPPGGVAADGDSELFLSITSEKKFWKFVNTGTTAPAFNFASPVKYPYGWRDRDPADNEAGLAVADFNGDGYADVLAPAQGDLEGTIEALGTVPVMLIGNGVCDGYEVPADNPTYDFDQRLLTFEISEPMFYLPDPPGAPPGTLRKVRIDVFHTPDIDEPTEEVAKATGTFDLPFDGSVLDGGIMLHTLPQLPEGFNPYPGGSPNLYSVVTRQVVTTSAGVIIDEGPAYTTIWTGERNTAMFVNASDVRYWTPTVNENEEPDLSGGTSTGPTVPPTNFGRPPRR